MYNVGQVCGILFQNIFPRKPGNFGRAESSTTTHRDVLDYTYSPLLSTSGSHGEQRKGRPPRLLRSTTSMCGDPFVPGPSPYRGLVGQPAKAVKRFPRTYCAGNGLSAFSPAAALHHDMQIIKDRDFPSFFVELVATAPQNLCAPPVLLPRSFLQTGLALFCLPVVPSGSYTYSGNSPFPLHLYLPSRVWSFDLFLAFRPPTCPRVLFFFFSCQGTSVFISGPHTVIRPQ
ncbi:hypothetical protein B0T20DRAFT_184744 [Sordaria brevicollis]|uniref:Uncharacterized protein n=1 Tax=Sordaria brevicollis TaxID=83679 RepID=A0AAE0UCD4_SORBR|nr:hypothetical protein B0T20DRAFT_184744 [Sordaria brevicollis]